MSYSAQTVAVLKEELKNRGLPATGVKAELVTRLEEDDISKNQVNEGLDATQETEAEQPITEQTTATEIPQEEAQTTTATEEQTVAVPTEQTEEDKARIAKLVERWEATIKDLQTQVKRLEKFGGDDSKLEKLKALIASNEAKITDINANGLRKKKTTTDLNAVAEAAPKLSPEEFKKLAIEHLTKKLERANKFGSDEEKNDITKELQRIEKFGIEADSHLARELGLAKDKVLGNHNGNRISKRRGGFRNKSRK